VVVKDEGVGVPLSGVPLIDHVAEIRPWFHGDQKLVLRDGSEVAWSRRYAAKRPDLLR
jgi:hypothetical protein